MVALCRDGKVVALDPVMRGAFLSAVGGEGGKEEGGGEGACP